MTGGDTEGCGYRLDAFEGEVALAAFNAAYVCPMQPCNVGKFLLRKLPLAPQTADGEAETPQGLVGFRRHTWTVRRMMTMSLQTMSSVGNGPLGTLAQWMIPRGFLGGGFWGN